MPRLNHMSVPNVADFTNVVGDQADPLGKFDMILEVPHGATYTDDFHSLRAELQSPLPDGLLDFFHVNTDAGAPELALQIAMELVEADPTRMILLIRCRVPRTFIDCNRRIDASAEDFKAGKVTAAMGPWITHPMDQEILLEIHQSYTETVTGCMQARLPHAGIVMVHTYAPRSVGVEVDLEIGKNIRRAYEPDLVDTWPLRPEIDIIGRDVAGVSHAPAEVVAELKAQLAPLGLEPADSATYPMHPSTEAYHHVMANPGRALCIEVRRDLLADPWDPFTEMTISADKCKRLAVPIAAALRTWWRDTLS